MERFVEHKLGQACYAFTVFFRVFSVFSWVIASLVLGLNSHALAQSNDVYGGLDAKNGKNNFAFLVFNNDYSKNITPIGDHADNKKGMLKLLAGLAVPDDNILTLDNPNKSDLEDAVYEFSRKLNRKSNLLVYYNGHNINFVDAEQNEMLLTSFKLPRSNDLFLLERRVSRSSVNLETLILDFIPKRVGQVTVLYDACNTHFVTRDDDLEHWKVFNRAACASSAVPGAEVIYAGSQSDKASFVNALTSILQKAPTLDLLALEKALAEQFDDSDPQEGPNYLEPVLITGSRSKDLSETCLRKGMQGDEQVCNVKPVEVVKVAAAPEIKAESVKTPKKTKTVVKDKKKKSNRSVQRADWTAAKKSGSCEAYQGFIEKHPSGLLRIKADTAIAKLCKDATKKTIVKTQEAKAPAEKPRNMRDDWTAAKMIGRCKPYKEFVENYPDSPFISKAKRAKENLCGPTEKAPAKKKPDLVKPKPKVVEVITPEKPRNMRDDWTAAKMIGRCKPYKEFVENYPDSPFISKAKRAKENLCGPTEKAPVAKVVEAPIAEAEKPEVPVVVEAPVIEVEPVKEVAKLDPPKPAPVAPKKKTAFKSWSDARRENSCEGFLQFLEDHPKSLFGSKAKARTDAKCSDADRKAFLEKPKATEEPAKPVKEPAKVVVVDKPLSNAICAAKTSEIYIAKTKVPVLSKPEGAVLFNYKKATKININGENDGYLTVRINVSSGPFKCGYIKKDETVISKIIVPPVIKKPVEVAVVDKPSDDDKEPKLFPGVTAKASESNYAFVVINQNYAADFEKVDGIDADKDAILATIDGLKYPKENVKVLLDPSKVELEDAAFEFGLEMKPDSELLFYYSGYSVSSLDDHKNYILPVDFKVPKSKQVRINRRRFNENSIDLATLIKDLHEGRPRQFLAIYNACSVQGLPSDKDAPYWVFIKQLPCSPTKIRDAAVFYPVQKGQLAITSLGKNDPEKSSLFMRVFAKAISENPSINTDVLQQKLARSVAALARKRKASQDPVMMDGYSQDSKNRQKRCFAKVMVNDALSCTGIEGVPRVAEPEVVIEEPTPPEPVKPKASDAWTSAKLANTCEAYQDFKKANAGSIFEVKANAKIKIKCVAPAELLPASCQAPTGAQTVPGLNKAGYREMQSELNRLGCNVGYADGDWGRNSQRGYNRFVSIANVGALGVKPSCAILEQVKALPTKRMCPVICGTGYKKVGESCVRIKPVVTTPTPAPVATTTPKVTTSSTKTESAVKAVKEEKRAIVKETTPEPAATVVPQKTCPKDKTLNKRGKCVPKKGSLGKTFRF